MCHNSILDNVVGVDYVVLRVIQALLVILEEHDLAGPKDKNQEHEAERIEKWNTSRVHQTCKNYCNNLSLDKSYLKFSAEIELV